MNVSQTAKFALVIAARPDFHNPRLVEPERCWREFLSDMRARETLCKGFARIHENVWQIDLNDGMPLLAYLLEKAVHNSIPLHSLFLDGEPDWIKYPPDAKPAGEV